MSEKNLDKERIIKALETKGANKPCHRCGSHTFSLLDKHSYMRLIDDWDNVTYGGEMITVPVFLIACTNCGAITPHAVGAFEEIPKKADAKKEDVAKSKTSSNG